MTGTERQTIVVSCANLAIEAMLKYNKGDSTVTEMSNSIKSAIDDAITKREA